MSSMPTASEGDRAALAAAGARGAGSGGDGGRCVMVESNYRVYAYTRSVVQHAVRPERPPRGAARLEGAWRAAGPLGPRCYRAAGCG